MVYNRTVGGKLYKIARRISHSVQCRKKATYTIASICGRKQYGFDLKKSFFFHVNYFTSFGIEKNEGFQTTVNCL
jgi:hypothetical protein